MSKITQEIVNKRLSNNITLKQLGIDMKDLKHLSTVYQDLEKDAKRTWNEIRAEYMREPNSKKFDPQLVLDEFIKYLSTNYKVPEKR